jgi:hypothetical protein
MEFSPNPAQRLYYFIKKLEPYYLPHNRQNITPLEIWAKVLHTSSTDEKDIIKAFFNCNKLIDKVEDLLKGNPNTNKEIYLAPIPRLREVFSFKHIYNFPNINGNNLFNHSDLTALQFCVDAVGGFSSEKVIDEKELNKISEEIKKLYSDIRESDLEKKLKELLLDLLNTMENSIHEYEIRGIEKINEAVANLFGKLFINKDRLKNNEKKTAVVSVAKVLSKFISFWAFSSDSFGNIEGLSKHIPLLPEYMHQVKEVGEKLLNS